MHPQGISLVPRCDFGPPPRVGGYALATLSFPEGHQGKMQHQPDRNRKSGYGHHPVPTPGEIMRLNRKNRDHEIIAEASVAEEDAIFGKFAAKTANKGKYSQSQHQEGDE